MLDFFGGSASTAHAIIDLNASTGSQRRFILVQLAESVPEKSPAATAGYGTIADIARDRIRRVGSRIDVTAKVDRGFRSMAIDTTNFAGVLRAPDDLVQASLVDFTDSIKPERTGEDLLFEVLLSWGLELTMPVEVETIDGREVLVVADDALIACFADDVSDAVVKAIAKRGPLRAVFRDSGFVTDAARINAEQIFKEVSPATDIKAI